MKKASTQIKSLADLRAVSERALPLLDPEIGGHTRVVVGLATCGIAAGAQGVYDAIRAELDRQGLADVLLIPTGCIGICQFEPVVEVYTPGQPKTTYVRMTPEKAVQVVDQHLRGGNPVAAFTIGARQ